MPKTEEIKRICSWCNEVMGTKIVELIENEFQGVPTNGICKDCYKREMRNARHVASSTGNSQDRLLSGDDTQQPRTPVDDRACVTDHAIAAQALGRFARNPGKTQPSG
jgi:hypothetical protein